MYSYSKDPLRLSAGAAPSLGQGAGLLAKRSIALKFAQRTTWSAAKAAGAGALRRLAASSPVKAVLAFMAACAAERRARETVRELESWDAHMLRDIGLERMDVEAAVRGVRPPFAWKPDCDQAAVDRLNDLR